MRYIMFVCGGESADVDAADADPAAWVDEMDGRGVRLQGSRLRPVGETRTVRVRDGEVVLSDGPFAETKEQIAGFDLLECRDIDEATQVAAKHPSARFGSIVVRALWEE